MDLKLLGLTDYEEKVYITLAKSGKSSAGEISRESNVPYGKIYVILEKLEAKNLVNIIPEKTKKFIEALQSKVQISVEIEDERLTSQLAERLLKTVPGGKKQKGNIDRQAAILILESYIGRNKK